MIDHQRQLAIIEQIVSAKRKAVTLFGVTVTKDNIEVTVTIEDKKNSQTPLDLNNIKQLVRECIITDTDGADFDSVINNMYDIISLHYSGRDIEIMIYDNIECLTVMKIFKTSINPAI